MHRAHHVDSDTFAVAEDYEVLNGWVTIIGEDGTVEAVPSHRVERIAMDTDE
jgi:hypothetical protein